MSIKPKSVDQFLESGCGRCSLGGTPECKVQSWVGELRSLREILQASGLAEEVKWSAPCYTHEGKNILMLSAVKDSVIISFFHGAELTDPEGILEKPGEFSRFARYLRFTNPDEIESRKTTIQNYIREAIRLERSGKRTAAARDVSLEYPDELVQQFKLYRDFEKAFAALTPGRQRGYLIHFSSAKQPKTRTARIEKFMPKIFEGKGWNER